MMWDYWFADLVVFQKPNHLYVKIPSDEIGLQPVDNKAVEKDGCNRVGKSPHHLAVKNGYAEAGKCGT